MEEREKQEIDSDEEGESWNLHIKISIRHPRQAMHCPPIAILPLQCSKNILSRMNGCPAKGYVSNLPAH